MTKSDIDALVDGLPHSDIIPSLVDIAGVSWTQEEDVRCALYLAAGLNADGSEKAKAARATLHAFNDGLVSHIPGTWDGTTFTPDSAP